MTEPEPERSPHNMNAREGKTASAEYIAESPASSESLDFADNFTFRLVKRGDKYYFQDVRVSPPMANHEEAMVVQRWLEGRALDEINTKEFVEAFSSSGRCSGLQNIIEHLKEMLGD
jgi:hypothetical protein